MSLVLHFLWLSFRTGKTPLHLHIIFLNLVFQQSPGKQIIGTISVPLILVLFSNPQCYA